MVSTLTNVAAALLFMIFGMLISLAQANFYKFFFAWFSMPAWVPDWILKVFWSNLEK